MENAVCRPWAAEWLYERIWSGPSISQIFRENAVSGFRPVWHNKPEVTLQLEVFHFLVQRNMGCEKSNLERSGSQLPFRSATVKAPKVRVVFTVRQCSTNLKVFKRKSNYLQTNQKMIGGNNFISIQFRNQWTGKFEHQKSNFSIKFFDRKVKSKGFTSSNRKRWIDHSWRWPQGQLATSGNGKETKLDCRSTGKFLIDHSV